MNKADSDFLCLQELHRRIQDDPENAGWYMHRAYKLGGGCSVDEALEFAPEQKKPVFSVVTGVDWGKPGGDMTAKATFTREGGKLKLESIEHSEPDCRHDWCPSIISNAPDYCTKCGEDRPRDDLIEQDDIDSDWHMNPCKQGHTDVGAAGGVAHCYVCMEEIRAETTQQAMDFWNFTHPAEPVKLCAASVGGVRCQAMRENEGLFCAHHRRAKSRMYLPEITNEGLAFMMQCDGEQQ